MQIDSSGEIIFLLFLFGAVCLAVLGVMDFAQDRGSLTRRLAGGTEATASRVSARFHEEGTFFRLVVRPIRDLIKPKDDKEVRSVRARLIQAGFYSPNAVATYYATRILLGGGLPLVYSLLAPLMAQQMAVDTVVVTTLLVAGFGYIAPAFYLDKRIQARQMAIRHGFPDSLDLMIVCVEAGLGLDAAVARVGEEIGTAHPLLAEQFLMLGAELRAGKARDEAWRGLGTRTGVEEVNSLVSLLIQADSLGTSTADALRAHAADLRMKRMLSAEEKAQKLGVKMTFPLILLILPALMIVVGTPAFIQVSRVVGPAIQNMATQ